MGVNTCITLRVLTSVQRLCGIHGIGHSADQDKGSGGGKRKVWVGFRNALVRDLNDMLILSPK